MAQLWSVQHLSLGGATVVVVGRVYCDGCVGSNIGYCNKHIENIDCLTYVNTALILSL